ncbi:MAG: peptidoglycan-binding protein [Alphaproteobacteria bacterium]
MNRSENYALAIGTLADYIADGKAWKPAKRDPAVRLKTDDIIKVQSFINRLGLFKLDEDGQLGSKTREAVKRFKRGSASSRRLSRL